jgi:hypothetical protein
MSLLKSNVYIKSCNNRNHQELSERDAHIAVPTTFTIIKYVHYQSSNFVNLCSEEKYVFQRIHLFTSRASSHNAKEMPY